MEIMPFTLLNDRVAGNYVAYRNALVITSV
jgi:hypothetical protein